MNEENVVKNIVPLETSSATHCLTLGESRAMNGMTWAYLLQIRDGVR